MTKWGVIRVSSEEQKIRGVRIKVDTERLIKQGILPEHIKIDAGKTGGIPDENLQIIFDDPYFIIKINLTQRIGLRQIIREAKPGDQIIASEYDRISRINDFLNNFITYFERKNIQISTLDDTNDPMLREIKGVISKYELKKTKERNNRISKGRYEAGIHPYRSVYGYRKNITDKQGKLLYPNQKEGTLITIPEEKAKIIQVFQDTIEGLSYKTICQKHNIQPQTYYDIIKNDIYTGKIHYQQETKQGLHEPFITEETYNQAQSKINTKKTNH